MHNFTIHKNVDIRTGDNISDVIAALMELANELGVAKPVKVSVRENYICIGLLQSKRESVKDDELHDTIWEALSDMGGEDELATTNHICGQVELLLKNRRTRGIDGKAN